MALASENGATRILTQRREYKSHYLACLFGYAQETRQTTAENMDEPELFHVLLGCLVQPESMEYWVQPCQQWLGKDTGLC